MEIFLVLDRFDTGEEEVKRVQIESLDDILINHIESVAPYKSYIAFNEYYHNYNMMNYQRCFPYIRSNGNVQWTVPYEDVSINDFLSSNNLTTNDPIKVNINNVGGAGDIDFSSIITWIELVSPYIKEWIDTADGVLNCLKITRVVYKFFSNKKKQVPEVRDVQDIIFRRRVWTIKELEDHLGCTNKKLLERHLDQCGYQKDGNEYILYSRTDEIDDLLDEAAPVEEIEYWGSCEFEGSRYDDLKPYIQELNIALTALLCQSDYYNTECFSIMKKRVELFLEKYDPLLTKGDIFQFVTIDTKTLFMQDFPIGEIESDIRELNKCINDMFIYIQESI